MKPTNLFFFAFASLAASSVSVASTPKIESGSYSVDTMHSKVGFEVGHLVIASVEGRFDQVGGTIEMGKKLEDTRINAKIDVKSVSTGNADRDKHLLSPDFFDAAKFPEMTFVSKKISGSPTAMKVSGDLTLHGVTKPVTLEGKYLGNVIDMYGNTKVAFVAKGKINRKDFGLTWSKAVEAGPVVGDDVSIDLKIEGGKPAAKK
ncbi:YceI family protein [bacterium]|jgi:polyisoprenoid-binding protein YceI|nr:YceI family protein [bacterium]